MCEKKPAVKAGLVATESDDDIPDFSEESVRRIPKLKVGMALAKDPRLVSNQIPQAAASQVSENSLDDFEDFALFLEYKQWRKATADLRASFERSQANFQQIPITIQKEEPVGPPITAQQKELLTIKAMLANQIAMPVTMNVSNHISFREDVWQPRAIASSSQPRVTAASSQLHKSTVPIQSRNITVPSQIVLPSCASRFVSFPTEDVDGDLDLEQALDRFCNAQPSDMQTKSQEEEEVLKRHVENLEYKDGRYVTSLPWKEEIANCPRIFL